ncbi:MAG: hypothetical protein B0D91_09450 [Oceanospirillales bacterium LUC14_002_19_P2]|nr:MAG: hypothetical protein B0D91_09450 [Oceanospirillales bacterium LUC14_002_19_P2]
MMQHAKIREWLLAITLAGHGGNSVAMTLQEAVAEALRDNPELRMTMAVAEARRESVQEASAGYLPTLDLNASVGYENSRNTKTVAAYGNGSADDKSQVRTRREASLVARQMLFDGFATREDVSQQSARQQAAEQQVCVTAENLGLEVAEVYLNVLKAQTLRDHAKNNLNEHLRLVALIRKQGEKGVSNDADLAQAEGRLMLAQADRIGAEAVLRNARTRYHKTVGALPDVFVRPAQTAGLPAGQEMAIEQLMTGHPSLAAADAEIRAAEAVYYASKSGYLPELDVTLGTSWAKDRDGVKGTEYDESALLNIRYNLFNGGADTARRQQASHEVSEAIENRQHQIEDMEEAVRLAWVAVEFGRTRLKPLKNHVSLADRSRSLYEKQFLVGKRTLIDLLDSQQESFAAQNRYTTADHDLAIDQYRLLHTTGRLLPALQTRLAGDWPCASSVSQQDVAGSENARPVTSAEYHEGQ